MEILSMIILVILKKLVQEVQLDHKVSGFNLTASGDYEMRNKTVYNLDTPDDHKIDDDYETRIRDLKSIVNEEYLNDKFLKTDKDGNYFDLRRYVIKNTEPFYDGLYDDNDLVSKVYVDMENSKQDIAIGDKANKSDVLNHDLSGNLDMNGKEVINLKPFVEDDDKDQVGHVIDFSFFHTERGESKRDK